MRAPISEQRMGPAPGQLLGGNDVDRDGRERSRAPKSFEFLEHAAAVSLRLIVVGFTLAVVVLVLARLRLVVLPVVLALVLATALAPPVARLRRLGLRPAVATILVLGAALALLAGGVAVVVPQVASQLGDVGDRAGQGLDQIEGWLSDRVTPWPDDGSLSEEISRWTEQNRDTVSAGIASGAMLLLEIVTGLLLALVVLFFLLKDGERLGAAALRLVHPERRPQVSAVGQRAWDALGGYVRGAAINGLTEAVLVGIALAVVGVPLVLPLAAITFFAGFLPVVGAIVAGTVAALVALVAGGVADALIVAVIFTVVQQLQNNVLEPLILGRSVQLHPLAILLSLTAGAVLAGIVGALIAVPLVAVVTAALSEAREVGLIDTSGPT